MRPLFPLLILAILTSFTTQILAEESSKRVLVFGIDGCRFDAMTKAKTPQLDLLIKQGIHSPTAQILGDRYRKNNTISGPGWSSILTGVWADKHNVQGNSFKEPNIKQYPHFFHYVKLNNPSAKTFSTVDWDPIAKYIVSSADVSLSTKTKDLSYEQADDKSAAAASEYLLNDNPTAMMVYLGAVDETGHSKGFHPSVPEYISAIERVDRQIGEILSALEKRKAKKPGEDWLIVLSSDHGGAGRGHGGGHNNPDILNSFLIVSGASAQRGKFDKTVYIVDVVPTALSHLGIQIKDDWKIDGTIVGLK
jgi:predicted AlkP superfamily pyrophosphatase or phosphodiesterase